MLTTLKRLRGWIDSLLYDPPRDGNTRTQYIVYDYAYVGELLRYVEKLKKRKSKSSDSLDADIKEA